MKFLISLAFVLLSCLAFAQPDEAELEKAQAEVNLATIEYKNTASLAERNVVAPSELAMAKAKLDKAKDLGVTILKEEDFLNLVR